MTICPACQGERTTPLFPKMGLTYVRCAGCGLRFVFPMPEASGRQYDDPEYFQRLALDTEDRSLLAMKIETNRRRVAELRRVGAREPLLEIGCGVGLFLGEAGGLVPTGVDVSLAALRVARSRHVHRITLARPERLPFPRGSFRTVALYDTLEHLPDPRAALQEVARVLASEGHLHVTTPDVGSFSAHLLGRSFPHYNPEHLSLFDGAALTRLLHETGFRPLSRSAVRKPLTPAYLASRLALYPVPILSPLIQQLVRLAPRLARTALPLPSGEMSLLAQRTSALSQEHFPTRSVP